AFVGAFRLRDVVLALDLRIVIDERTRGASALAAHDLRWRRGRHARIGETRRRRSRRPALLSALRGRQVLALAVVILVLVILVILFLADTAPDHAGRVVVVHVAIEVVVAVLVADLDPCAARVESEHLAATLGRRAELRNAVTSGAADERTHL